MSVCVGGWVGGSTMVITLCTMTQVISLEKNKHTMQYSSSCTVVHDLAVLFAAVGKPIIFNATLALHMHT